MQDLGKISGTEWIGPLKKRILLGLLGLLTLSMAAAMVLIVVTLRNSLISDSVAKTRGLSSTIHSNLRILMLKRDPDMIQETLDAVGKSNNSIVKAFVLDKNGRVAYSSDREEIGKVLDRHREESCRDCHQELGRAPSENVIVFKSGGIKIHRNVKVIYNEKACHECHSRSDRINGKLIIDRSLKQTYSLIHSIELIVFGSGAVCLVFLVPFLSRRLDKYIVEIVGKNREIAVLLDIANRLSKTIDIEELKHIVIGIVRDTSEADEITIVFPNGDKGCRIITWDRSKNEIVRKKISEGDPLLRITDSWLNGGLEREDVSEDGKQVYTPIAKGDTRLALIALKRIDRPFDLEERKLNATICNFMAMAFENARLYTIAITDELTHLFTQRHFRHCIDRAFLKFEKYGEKIAFLMLDIDNFKKINDTYGHMTGDSVLKEVARRILYSVRDSDLVFRYGGEEFTVILPSTDVSGGESVAERIRRNIEGSVFEKEKQDLRVTISIGVSTCPDHAQTARDLIISADKALYEAKASGKNRVVISGGGKNGE